MAESRTSKSHLFRVLIGDWRQNIIYIGFIVLFLIFAVTLSDKGFLTPKSRIDSEGAIWFLRNSSVCL